MVRGIGAETWARTGRGRLIAGGLGLVAVGLGLFGLWGLGYLGASPFAALVGLSLAFLAAAVAGVAAIAEQRARAGQRRILELVAEDRAAWFATDEAGHVLLRNAAAEQGFGQDTASMLAALSRHMLDPGQVLRRLQGAAAVSGTAQKDIALTTATLRLSVQRAGTAGFLWRIEDFPATLEAASADLALDRSAGTTDGGEIEDIPVPLMTFGRDGVLRRANQMARDLILQGEAQSALFHELFDGLGRPVSDWLADVVSGRLPGGTEVLRARKAGEDAYVQVTLHRHEEGGRIGAIAVLHDATQLKSLEAQFVQSQKMQAIGQLAGGIAHDFNNLLTAISGHCDLLLLRHGREDSDFADLEQIRQNANRAAALVGQLLAFSRKQTLQPELLDVEEILSDLTHLLNRLVVEKVGLRLVHRGQALPRPLRPIRADRRQLEQVVVNLVVNARDAMPEGGSIVIQTEPVTLVEDLRRDRAVVPAGDYSVIRVIDQGTGIAPDNLKKIFEPFFTTKRVGEGTGLGLSMAYGIVKQSGGFIFADSTLGEGSTFSLYFPAHDPVEVVETPPEPRRRSVRQGAGVVLLVEDEAPVRAFAGRALRLRGYTVLEAENAEEALKTLEDPALEVDVFVTDVVMPGMDGPTWVRQALKTRPNVRVVFVSGYAEDVLNNDQGGIQNSVFLPKPFSLNDLTRTVQGQFH